MRLLEFECDSREPGAWTVHVPRNLAHVRSLPRWEDDRAAAGEGTWRTGLAVIMLLAV